MIVSGFPGFRRPCRLVSPKAKRIAQMFKGSIQMVQYQLRIMAPLSMARGAKCLTQKGNLLNVSITVPYTSGKGN